MSQKIVTTNADLGEVARLAMGNSILDRADGFLDTLEQGHALVAEIVAERQKTLMEMRLTDNHEMWQEMAAYRHNLSLAKRQVQAKMQKIVISKRGGRNAIRFK